MALADQQFKFAEADVIAVFQHVIVILAQGHLCAVDVSAVGARVDENVSPGPKIDAGVFAREVTLRVG